MDFINGYSTCTQGEYVTPGNSGNMSYLCADDELLQADLGEYIQFCDEGGFNIASSYLL